jgi:hypothetical protein
MDKRAHESIFSKLEEGRRQFLSLVEDVRPRGKELQQFVDDREKEVERPDPWQRIASPKGPSRHGHRHGALDHVGGTLRRKTAWAHFRSCREVTLGVPGSER